MGQHTKQRILTIARALILMYLCMTLLVIFARMQ